MKRGIFLLFLLCLNCVTSNQFLSFATASLNSRIFKIATSISPMKIKSGAYFIKRHLKSKAPEKELKSDESK